jgi:hypothetical protein
MSKKDAPLKKVINQLLRAYGYNDMLDEIALMEAYDEVVGKMFVNHTVKKFYKNKILFVQLDSAALKQEMSYMKTPLILKINQLLGKKIIEDIIIK